MGAGRKLLQGPTTAACLAIVHKVDPAGIVGNFYADDASHIWLLNLLAYANPGIIVLMRRYY